MKKIQAEFKIFYYQYLDIHGKALENTDGVMSLPAFAKDFDFLIKVYQMMMRTRAFDTKAIVLQRTGKLGTYASSLGQEAIGVAIGACMQESDVLCPSYREYAAQFWRKVKMSELLLYWGGDERGSDYHDNIYDFPISVPVSSQTLHAVGVAMAMKLKNEARVAVTVLGDGATSRGDFYEAMNLAGVWQLPVVFVINNNQWAISMNRHEQTFAKTLAQKGIAAGIASEQVDGNDVIALIDRIGHAVERARKKEGPTVIEADTYRMSDHTTADDARRYRDIKELEIHFSEDPILRLNQYLTENKVWNSENESALQQMLNKEVTDSVNEYLSTKKLSPEIMFDYLYQTLPKNFEADRQEVINDSKTSNDAESE